MDEKKLKDLKKSNILLDEMPNLVKDYCLYLRNIKGRNKKTVDEYCLDLRTFFRFMKNYKNNTNIENEKIIIKDIDIDFIKNISSVDIFTFMNFIADDCHNMASTRQRKTSTLKGFFTHLNVHEKLITENPTENLASPKKRKTLPKYLNLEQSIDLLKSVDGSYKERDYCILVIFLNCGLRLSELVSINLKDVIRNNSTIRIIGKGNKERIVFLNEACIAAIDEYLKVRPVDKVKDKEALFLSGRLNRISPKTVQFLVNKYLEKIGLKSAGYSVHKLRHTAATLMHQNGTDIRVLQDILGHENLGTTEIYTHVSNKQLEEASKNNPLSKIKI